ncbi:MAG: glycosyltransferase involved in cell wall biosynthesis [Planctomycetota bacterium]
MSDSGSLPLALIANARMPSQRAQSLQVLQVAAAFARAGTPTTLLHARRFPTPSLPAGTDLFEYYGLGPGPRPKVEAVPCLDWIDRVPTRFQYVPARAQELTFARNAARHVQRSMPSCRVLSREAESARALLAGKRPHSKVYVEVHRVPGGRTRKRWLLEVAAGARGLIAISGGVRDDLISLGIPGDEILVEHDGFEASRGAGSGREDARAKIGVTPDAKLVVYTGGLLDWKGVDLLVDAARELPELTFVIAGGMDADVAKLRSRYASNRSSGAPDNVRLDGFVAPKDIRDYLSAADLGIVPNRSKPAISAKYTSPLKVFEAMDAGLPLVMSDLPSLRDILDDTEACYFAADDAAALGRAIAKVMGDGALRASMSSKMKARAKNHSWDARAKRILDWMDKRETMKPGNRGAA